MNELGYKNVPVLISTYILYPLVHTFYRVGGRSKEIIVTAGGENVAPIPIEDAIKVEIKHILSFNRFTDFFVLSAKINMQNNFLLSFLCC